MSGKLLRPISQLQILSRSIVMYPLGPRGSHFAEVHSATSSVDSDSYGVQHIAASKTFEPELLKLPLARYGGRQTVTVLAGDGIGPEMLQHVKDIFKVAQVPVDFEDVMLDSRQAGDDASLENALISIERNGVALKGDVPASTRLDLYANVLRCKSVPGVRCKHPKVDIVMIRENTEGEYSGIEHETLPGVVESLKIVTRKNIERIARFAFEYAIKFKRQKITAIHKANIMKIGDGLFLKVCEEMAMQYPGLKFDNMIIDNASMQLVSNPQQFDVCLMPNLYGNILSNIGCGIVGGPGLVSGINVGEKYAVFETGSRNTGTSLAGQDIANPVSFLRAAVDMLYYLKMDSHADLIHKSIMKLLTMDKIHTPDLGGSAKTSEFIEALKGDILSKIVKYH